MVISHTIKFGEALMLDAKKCAIKILNASGMSGPVKNQLNLGVISSMRWSTVSKSNAPFPMAKRSAEPSFITSKVRVPSYLEPRVKTWLS